MEKQTMISVDLVMRLYNERITALTAENISLVAEVITLKEQLKGEQHDTEPLEK